MSKAVQIFFLVAVFMGGCGDVLYAQESYVGFKGGVSLPRLSGGGDNEVSRDYKSRTALNAGLFLDWAINERLSIRPEISFAGQGGKRKGVQPITSPLPGLPALPTGVYYFGDFETDAVLNYLEIPVVAKYRWGEKSSRHFFAIAGAYYGHLLSAKTTTRGSSTLYIDKKKTPLLIPPANQPLPPISFAAETDIKNDVHHENFGITAGGGLEFPQGKNYLLFEARLSYGLRKIQIDTVRNGGSHTGSLVLSVGYAFGVR